MLWNGASSGRGINELSEALAISFERSCRSGKLLKKQKKEKVVSVFQKIEITITRKAKQCASGPSKGRPAEPLVLYFTQRVNIPLGCCIHRVSKEEKTAKLPNGQWPNCDMEEQQLSAPGLLSGKTTKNLKVHLQCRKPHPRGQYYLPKQSAPYETLDFVFNPFNHLQRKTIHNIPNQNFTLSGDRPASLSLWTICYTSLAIPLLINLMLAFMSPCWSHGDEVVTS